MTNRPAQLSLNGRAQRMHPPEGRDNAAYAQMRTKIAEQVALQRRKLLRPLTAQKNGKQ